MFGMTLYNSSQTERHSCLRYFESKFEKIEPAKETEKTFFNKEEIQQLVAKARTDGLIKNQPYKPYNPTLTLNIIKLIKEARIRKTSIKDICNDMNLPYHLVRYAISYKS
jgi:hypothetical protein